MGFLWDLVQHSQIQEQGERTGSLEGRVAALERELRETRELLAEALKRLESRFGDDLDGDGRVG
jgi:uncharacterized protein involved in exopolysaccharide biosynthesis